MTTEQGGAIANRQGNILEQQVRQAFASHGFREVSFAEYEKIASGSTLPGVPVPDLLVRRVPYQSIYGHRGVTEFLAVSASRGLAIRIECKWQQSQGSVDEKFPYLYLNCIQAMPEREIILLIDGNGYKPGALAWLKQAVASQDAKNKMCRFPPARLPASGLQGGQGRGGGTAFPERLSPPLFSS